MTFLEFKEQYKILTRGDVMIAGDDELKLLMALAAKDIHRAVTPLEKIELDYLNLKKDFDIDDKYFVREFLTPKNDNDEIDFIDEMLLMALVYHIAKQRARGDELKNNYEMAYKRALMEYEFNNFSDESYNLEMALGRRGWLKPYVINDSLEPYYEWDEKFIANLDFYMANVSRIKNLNYRKFIYLFIDYQNNKTLPSKHLKDAVPIGSGYVLVNQREDLKALDRFMSKKILGV
ncbi:hypothetical protein [Campylobacter gastrosuis]|uniref:Uncharacterized protein n=1 Tax=Campylobacter gastrosuis TaxID=2974576 RepID=A0ABT7HQ17_9BACT|nr:hypothetical protein [Campylobacter gastrosuis]MDL0088489.1 hypothetical protein [Campylobacter gastrosuis]